LKATFLDEWSQRTIESNDSKGKGKEVLPVALGGFKEVKCYGCGKAGHKKVIPVVKQGNLMCIGYPGRYYAVLRNTVVIPAIFEWYLQGVTCTMGTQACSLRVEGYLNVVK
jgi:hypothetical protein